MKIRVLVIDDEVAVRDSIQKSLTISDNVIDSIDIAQKKAGLFNLSPPKDFLGDIFLDDENFDVVLSNSGEQGLVHVKESLQSRLCFQVIFVDIRMPGMNGDECARQIRELDKNVAICLITGFSDKSVTSLVRVVGGSLDKLLFLKKPFEQDEIRQIVRAFSAKWYSEKKNLEYLQCLERLVDDITTLEDTHVQDPRGLANHVLSRVLHYVGAESGFIAEISDSGELNYEFGHGLFTSHADIENLIDIENLKVNKEGETVLYVENDKVIVPLIAVRYQRIVVALGKDKIPEETLCFIRIFAKNAAIALANSELIEELNDTNKNLEVKVKERTQDLEAANKQLETIAIRDSLTGAYTRRFFNEALTKSLFLARKKSSNLILLMIDIDFFKSLNDMYGHDAGDEILRELSSNLFNQLSPEDVICRYGGDEFLVMLHDLEQYEGENVAKRIMVSFDSLPQRKRYTELNLGLSIGVASLNSDIYNIRNNASFFKKVDEALYLAKKNGRHRIETWVPTVEISTPLYDIQCENFDVLAKKLSEISYQSKKDFTEQVTSIIAIIENKDTYTAHHSKNVGVYTRQFLQALNLDEKYINEIHVAAVLHDIGKLVVPIKVLQKDKKLTEDEWKLIKQHPVMGVKLLTHTNLLGKELFIIKHIHERFDGTGYPDGLKSKHIPLGSRIITIADSFDAITNTRPYRKKMDLAQTLSEIKNRSGSQFDPELLNYFIKVVEEQEWPL